VADAPWLPLAAVSVVLLAALAAVVTRHGPAPLPVDRAIHEWVLRHRNSGTTSAALVVTITGSGLPAYALAAAAGIVTCPRRWWLGGAVFLLALLAGQGVRLLIVASLRRPRPPMSDWAAGASGWSFPSGHTTTAALVAALISVAVWRGPGTRWSRGVPAAALAWAGAVGLTRVYLGVHWATDVVGGWLLVLTLAAAAASLARVPGRPPDAPPEAVPPCQR
jgi:membrane-associated phospholipid phosphatase